MTSLVNCVIIHLAQRGSNDSMVSSALKASLAGWQEAQNTKREGQVSRYLGYPGTLGYIDVL